MTDYYPLLARAVTGLDKNTGEARRALYERARNALVAQLRSSDPPLSETEITRERLALEEAVRKVEADAARQMRSPAPPERPSAPPPRPDEPPLPRSASTPRPPAPAPTEGVRGMRDVVAEAETLGEATAQGSRTAREAYAAVPSNSPDLDRMEPRAEPEGLRPARRPGARAPEPPPHPAAQAGPPPRRGQPSSGQAPVRRPPSGPLPRQPVGLDSDDGGGAARRGLVAALLTVLIITGLGAGAYWQRETISGWFSAARQAPSTPREATPPRTKDNTRVGQEGQSSSPAGQPGTGQPPAMVAQRVVLYEEDPANPDGNRYVGSALWRTETVSPGPGLAPELAIRADVEVPERRLAMTMSIRRNTDQALPASHTVEIMFNLPADFAMGGVGNVPGLLMKEAEQSRGAPLSGLAVKVTDGFFLIGLSSVEADQQRNIQLLRERSWFDIPMVYKNGRRAILAVEKGTPGERAFNEAFAAWGK